MRVIFHIPLHPRIPVVCEMDLAVIVDGSGSITEQQKLMSNWDIIKNFLKSLVNTLRIGPKQTQLGIVTFGSSATLEFDFNEYHNDDDIFNAIDHLNYDVSKRMKWIITVIPKRT